MTNRNAAQEKMENIFHNTCGSWEDCNELDIQLFFQQCLKNHIDPNYCMSWVEQHKAQMPNW
ncbi:hypothetical protein LGQ02_03745 [Bacillus shivajii]|uniref:hypothetical protein n=1 Tax=Bacillus shivajii TaxID=1983719 RepID=UPI001CFB69F9|nr:hypothetical protein [Bacillus shivajii]UCZ53908.1 hypothetical protein LGQ02_03745 [Bacillus shivajii]